MKHLKVKHTHTFTFKIKTPEQRKELQDVLTNAKNIFEISSNYMDFKQVTFVVAEDNDGLYNKMSIQVK